MADTTKILLIVRDPKNVQFQTGADIPGTWTNIDTVPWRKARPFLGAYAFEEYVQRRIDEDGARVWLELRGPEGERRAVAELTTYRGIVRVMREPSEPGPLRRYNSQGRRSAAIYPFKPRQHG
jgi:hypothetical protein